MQRECDDAEKGVHFPKAVVSNRDNDGRVSPILYELLRSRIELIQPKSTNCHGK